MTFTKISSVSREDIKSFLMDRNATETCSCCGERSLAIIDCGDNTVSLLFSPNKPIPGAAADTFPLAAVACQNCGNIRLHAIGTVIEWKNEQFQG